MKKQTIVKKIGLVEWGKKHFAVPPHINTLRKWARDGFIKPAPIKTGKSYLVEPNAQYSQPELTTTPKATK